MKNLWQRFLEDETGVILSSELALVGTVGVLGLVVGLEAVTCAVNSELNDLASAFGAIDQSFNYRSLSKVGHARVSGSGFNDSSDFCDCAVISQGDVSGARGLGGSSQATFGQSQATFSQSAVVNSAPVVREQVIQERMIDEVLVQPTTVRAATQVCPDDEIIEEHIIRRRVRADCDYSTTTDCDTTTKVIPKTMGRNPLPSLKPQPDTIETKTKKKS